MDEKPKYWFKRKRYGRGWTPVTWQGWLLLVGFIVFITVVSLYILRDVDENSDEIPVELFYFYGILGLSILVLLAITREKAPKGKWRWGKKADDNPEEDL